MNFTDKFDPKQGTPKNNPDPRPRSADGSKVWERGGGPNGQGAWVTPNDTQSYEQHRTFDKGRWAGEGEQLDINGLPIDGTSGADVDAQRYRDMRAPWTTTPIIDQEQSNETRGIGMGALDLLKRTAEGKSPSAAEQMGTSLGQQSQDARGGIAASVRGGAASRAAAARGAVADQSTIGQQTFASNQATRAGEMAQGRGAYFGAATGMRGQDLGVATSQGNLKAEQRKADDARDAFYAGKAHDVQKTDVNQQLGLSAAQQNAQNQKEQQDAARNAASAASDARLTNTALTTAQGGINAYGNSQKPDPDPNTTSDEKAKKNMKPVSDRTAGRLKARARAMTDDTNAQREGFGLGKDPISDDPDGQPGDPLNGYIPPAKGATSVGQKPKLISDLEAAKLKKQAGDMQANIAAQREGFGTSNVNTPGNESAGRGEVEESPRSKVKNRIGDISREDPYAGGSPELQEAMRKAVEKEASPPERKMNPENPYTNSLFGHAEPGYAKMRAGQPGGMFGSDGASSDQAPGTGDFYAGGGKEPSDPYSRKIMGLPPKKMAAAGKQDIMMSDARAKQQAFQDGANWSLNGGEGGVPKYMPGTVNSQGGAKKSDSPVRGKDSTNQAAIDEYPTDPSQRSPEDRAKVAQLHQFVNDNEGDAFDRANPPGAGPPAARTSVANDMRNRTREYATSQDRDETPEQRTARFLKKSQDRKAQEKGAESPPSSPSKTTEGESPDERTQRFLNKSQDTSRPGAPAKWDTSSKVGPRSNGEEKPSILPKFMQPGQKIPGKLGEKLDAAGKRLTGPSAADEQNAEQDREIHANQLLTDKLQNLRTHSEIGADRKRLAEAGVTSSDEKSKREIRFGGPMAAANRSMSPKVYEYKEQFAAQEGQEPGDKNVGPMAQAMDKDPVASTVIVHDPETGLMGIDKAKGLKLVMGGLSDLQRQVDELHGKKKGSSHGR